MDAQIFTTVATGAMLAMFAAILAWQGKGRMEGLERQLTEFRSEMRSDLHSQSGVLRSEMGVLRSQIGDLRSELRSELHSEVSGVRSEIGELRSEMAIMRSDITHIALAVGARPRPQTG